MSNRNAFLGQKLSHSPNGSRTLNDFSCSQQTVTDSIRILKALTMTFGTSKHSITVMSQANLKCQRNHRIVLSFNVNGIKGGRNKKSINEFAPKLSHVSFPVRHADVIE